MAKILRDPLVTDYIVERDVKNSQAINRMGDACFAMRRTAAVAEKAGEG